MKNYTLRGNHTIPGLGLGTWKAAKGEVGRAVSQAIKIGYRHIDCAPIYQNQVEIGCTISRALSKKRCKRDELWITSKLWNNAHAARHVRPALERNLKELQIDYLDLFLIHWPVHFQANITYPKHGGEFLPAEAIPIMETWQAMEKLVKKGMCRCIGVCNFNIRRLDELYDQAHIKPAMNQIELHPYLQQNKMVDFCQKNEIQLTAYSPLGSKDRAIYLKRPDEPSLLDHPAITELATKYEISPARLLLAWGLNRDTVVIPKSVHLSRLRDNLAATEVTLDESDVATINGLDLGYRFVDGSFFTKGDSPYSLETLWSETETSPSNADS